MKRLFSILICVLMLMALLPATVSAAESEIKTLNIKIKDPVASYTPGTVIGMDSNINDPMGNIPTKIVTWKDTFNNKTLTNKDEFVAGLPYKVTVQLGCFVGYTFARDIYGQLAAKITINGKAATIDKVYYTEGKITNIIASYEYSALPGMVISSALVKGIPTPVAGNMPIYSFTINSNAYGFYHTEPITWYDETAKHFLDSGDTFVEGHRYTVGIWLAANRENGYTFKVSGGDPAVDVTLNSFAPDSVVTAYEQDPREVIAISYTFPACKAAHTHTPSNWRTTGIYHYTVCTTCGDFLEQEDHKGGTATCSQKGKCTVCGYEYIEENENHTPDTSKWVARADMYHFHKCTLCGAHCDIEDHRWSPKYHPVNASGHAYQCADCKGYDQVHPHNPGPEATADTPQTCKDCGYIIEPAKNHQHDLTKVPQTPATCTQEGNIEYYVCTGCNDCFTDAEGKNKIPETTSVQVGALGHTASESWSYDEQYHWRSCDICKVILEETNMHHEFADGICTTCGYKEGAQIEPSEETESTQPTEPEKDITPNQEPKDSNWMLIILVGLVCFGAATTVSVILLKKKKK